MLLTHFQPGHEYTKSNVKFAISVLQSDPVKKLQAFADTNQVTTGKFTIGDEKVRIESSRHFTPYRKRTANSGQEHNVFMRVNVRTLPSPAPQRPNSHGTDTPQDPIVQKATGATDPVDVMGKLREMKNNFK